MRKLLNTLYVTNPDAYLRKKDDAICVFLDEQVVMSIPFHLLESVVLFGHAGCSTSIMATCAEKGISVVLLDEGRKFKARVEGPVSGNVLLRREQYRRADDEKESLKLAKRFVLAKVHNARVVLQHFRRDYPELGEKGLDRAIDSLKSSAAQVPEADDSEKLRGIEGDAAHMYFGVFRLLLKKHDIRFEGRSKRPPKDPVNATLSFFYSILTREISTGCETVGLDPQMGFLHRCRPGRASLSLDLIEELRAPYVDRFVLTLFNRGQLDEKDFEKEGEGFQFVDRTLKKVLGLWQERKQEQILHPFLKERVPIGLLPVLQAQLLAAHLRGDLEDYPACLWR